ncbi:hypothetical protein A9Q84_09040 [Halobacteriovorax marinus]|uniref:Aminotransferase n=1 Tax=Halobacteriovorax marinus TaxID=97084 RepID=A0A1Y5F6R3_9BACT|nr:hypothetical protein A9Q84_09040 [Halobacteriovorax marinus]
MKDIGIFDLKYDEEFKQKFRNFCDEILDTAYLTNHVFVKRFENEFAKFSGSKFSLATTSGTTSLEAALRAVDVRGKEVILPTNTFIATAAAIINAGGIPKIIDVEPEYYSLCPENLKSSLTKEVAAVITVHIAGHISPTILELQKTCLEFGIPLIEDCAHAHGAKLNGQGAGNFGAFGCFSHFTTKVMTTGEGGSLICNEQDLYEKVLSIRQFGKDESNSILHTREGSNFKVTEFQAALGILELERINQRINKRRELALRYQENLKDSEWSCLTDNDFMLSSYYKQVIIPPTKFKRADIEKTLNEKGISLTGGVYNIPLHKQPTLKKFIQQNKYKVSDTFSKAHICPPCYPELKLKDIDRICAELIGMK